MKNNLQALANILGLEAVPANQLDMSFWIGPPGEDDDCRLRRAAFKTFFISRDNDFIDAVVGNAMPATSRPEFVVIGFNTHLDDEFLVTYADGFGFEYSLENIDWDGVINKAAHLEKPSDYYDEVVFFQA